MKIVSVFMILVIFLFSLSASINDVSAQVSTITIRSNGSVDPSSGIQRDGDTYVLTTDLNSPIEIQKGGIILDGANHKLEAPRYGYAAITLKASNVTVTNFNITGWTAGIYGAYNNNTIAGNEFTDNSRAIQLYATDYVIKGNIIQKSGSGIYIKNDILTPKGDNNLIINNQIISNTYAFHIISGNGTTITQNDVKCNDVILYLSGHGCHLLYFNNFVDNKQVLYVPPLTNGPILSQYSPVSPAGNWDNGTTGNYWSDYATRYPNASKMGISGIGNTPYLIEYLFEPEYLLGLGVDNYPLIHVYDRSDGSNTRYMAVAILVLVILITVLIVITCKKDFSSKKQKREDIVEKRNKWKIWQADLSVLYLKNLVFIDESSLNLAYTRLYGWAKSGKRVNEGIVDLRFRRQSILSTILA